MSHRQQAVYWRQVGQRLFYLRNALHFSLESIATAGHLTIGEIIEAELLGTTGRTLTVLCYLYGISPAAILGVPPWQRVEAPDPCGDLQIVPEEDDGQIPF